MNHLVSSAVALTGPAAIRKFMFYPTRGGELTFPSPVVSFFIDGPAQAKLHVVIIPTATNDARPILLHSHGNAGNVSMRVPSLRALAAALDCTVVAYDYSGFGLSTQTAPSETSILADGTAVLSLVTTMFPGRPVLVWGESMGGAVAANLALSSAVTAVVMHITFAQLADVVAPVAQGALSLLHDPLNSARRIAAARKPTIVTHASLDKLMPLASAQALYNAAPPQHRLFVSLVGDHNSHHLEPALPGMKAFLDQEVMQNINV